ncbi:MAG: hypothetical protein QOD30_925, partial [Actinomycetota bacterium]|nr:hypothetical protein [Actinomycetota bacterium]
MSWNQHGATLDLAALEPVEHLDAVAERVLLDLDVEPSGARQCHHLVEVATRPSVR